jgi:hypothetical protein
MDLNQKLNELQIELYKLNNEKIKIHERMKELKSQIGKLQTIAKHAQELFAETKPETV